MGRRALEGLVLGSYAAKAENAEARRVLLEGQATHYPRHRAPGSWFDMVLPLLLPNPSMTIGEARDLLGMVAGESECTCSVTPERMWTTHYGAVEPGSQIELDPDCPVHGTERPMDSDDAAWHAEVDRGIQNHRERHLFD